MAADSLRALPSSIRSHLSAMYRLCPNRGKSISLEATGDIYPHSYHLSRAEYFLHVLRSRRPYDPKKERVPLQDTTAYGGAEYHG